MNQSSRMEKTRQARIIGRWLMTVALALIFLPVSGQRPAAGEEVLRLATTTSTQDSGLLQEILPDFARQYSIRVAVIAVGTGQAMAIGRAGDADVLLVHARGREEDFVAAGHGLSRADVMYNDFILVGPRADPAAIRGWKNASAALAAIADIKAPFASRGDGSGTHVMEQELWEKAGLNPGASLGWYNSLGQGMGAALTFANERGAYALTDRATFLARRDNLPNLAIMVGGNTIAANRDPALRNPYGVIPVNPAKGRINAVSAGKFINWLLSEPVRKMIGEFGRERFGQPLFYPTPPINPDRRP